MKVVFMCVILIHMQYMAMHMPRVILADTWFLLRTSKQLVRLVENLPTCMFNII